MFSFWVRLGLWLCLVSKLNNHNPSLTLAFEMRSTRVRVMVMFSFRIMLCLVLELWLCTVSKVK